MYYHNNCDVLNRANTDFSNFAVINLIADGGEDTPCKYSFGFFNADAMLLLVSLVLFSFPSKTMNSAIHFVYTIVSHTLVSYWTFGISTF